MKTELIQYHRRRAKYYELMASGLSSDSPECLQCNAKMILHERAVEWLESIGTVDPDRGLYIAPMPKDGAMIPVIHKLESLDEGLAVSAAAEKQIQRENAPGFHYPVLTAEQVKAMRSAD
jgi:hypothetical protein